MKEHTHNPSKEVTRHKLNQVRIPYKKRRITKTSPAD